MSVFSSGAKASPLKSIQLHLKDGTTITLSQFFSCSLELVSEIGQMRQMKIEATYGWKRQGKNKRKKRGRK